MPWHVLSAHRARCMDKGGETVKEVRPLRPGGDAGHTEDPSVLTIVCDVCKKNLDWCWGVRG